MNYRTSVVITPVIYDNHVQDFPVNLEPLVSYEN